jgi:hypothetical protein
MLILDIRAVWHGLVRDIGIPKMYYVETDVIKISPPPPPALFPIVLSHSTPC